MIDHFSAFMRPPILLIITNMTKQNKLKADKYSPTSHQIKQSAPRHYSKVVYKLCKFTSMLRMIQLRDE